MTVLATHTHLHLRRFSLLARFPLTIVPKGSNGAQAND